MDSLIKSDIFFTVTTVVIIVVAALVIVLLVYAINIFRNVKKISETAKKEAVEIARDVSAFRKVLENFFTKKLKVKKK